MSETQTVIDLNQSSTGSIEVDSGRDGSLTVASVYTAGARGYRRLVLTDRQPGTASTSYVELELVDRTQDAGRTQTLRLARVSGDERALSTNEATSAPYLFTLDGPSVTVRADARGSTPDVTRISGTLTLGNRTLRADETDVMTATERVPGTDGAPRIEYTFREDGTLTVAASDGSSSRGTWAREDGAARVSVLASDGTLETALYTLERAGTGLVLTSRAPRSACSAQCLEDRIVQAGGRPGTLLAAWTETELHLSAASR